MDLSKEEVAHYSRHLLLDEIGKEGQIKLKATRVLVIGAGGLGCPILQYLTAAGIGTIGIIDGDQVSISNLQRQVLFNYNDIGQSKAVAAKNHLQNKNPNINFEIFDYYLTKKNARSLFKNFDIIIDGSDNFPTRYLVNDAAVLENKPLVFGAIYKFQGQVSVFNYKGGPTYRCLFPDPPQPGEVPNCSEIGVLGVLPGLVGCMQANEVLKMVLGIGSVLAGKFLTFDMLQVKQMQYTFKKTEAANVKSLAENYESFCGIIPTDEELSLSYETFLENESDYFLLDVRTLKERDLHDLGGAHIPLDELEDEAPYIDTDKIVLVYCETGIRSKKAVTTLEVARPDLKVKHLKGGISAIN